MQFGPLGFDNPRKALLTAVKEAVDNSLDACEEASIVPELWVHIEAMGPNRYKVGVQDNGPGIVKKQIPLIFGKLLYGSKFHRLRMSRGQQGIGISAAGMYGMLTTGKPVKIISMTSPKKPAHYFEIQIDTKRNLPEIINGKGDGEDIPAGEKGQTYITDQGNEWV
jgi:DNA topoisomerase-6 subunit B